MKTIKILFATLFLSSMFIACENDTVNEELGIEEIENVQMTEGETIDPEQTGTD